MARLAAVKSVLVVEDEFGIADALSELLSDEGFQVTVARNGKDALKRVDEHVPDIILLDYMMPLLDGSEVLKALRGTPRYQHIPVLMMSALDGIPPDCRPNAFLRKPFDVDVLLAKVAALLTNSTQ